jgi:hypothetical protein
LERETGIEPATLSLGNIVKRFQQVPNSIDTDRFTRDLEIAWARLRLWWLERSMEREVIHKGPPRVVES